MHQTKANNTSFVLALGFAMGAIVALLVTPKSGDNMRKDLKDSFDKIKQRTKDASDTLQDTVADTAGQVESAVRRNRQHKDSQGDQGYNVAPMP